MFKKMFNVVSAFVLSALALSTNANAAPLAAPDTTDLIGTIVAYGGAAVTIWISYILFPVAIRILKGLFK